MLAGALELAACLPLFPGRHRSFSSSSIPGVGSSRRGIAAEAGDYRFVAPDNGVLTVVLDEHPPKRVVELTERKYARPTVSRTFEGRDRFAPAAAWLAKGIDLTALGRPAGAIAAARDCRSRASTSDGIEGEVRARRSLRQPHHEHRSPDVRDARRPATLDIRVGPHQVPRVVSTYADAPPGEVCALFGSTDHLEIAANGASAAAALGCGAAPPCTSPAARDRFDVSVQRPGRVIRSAGHLCI